MAEESSSQQTIRLRKEAKWDDKAGKATEAAEKAETAAEKGTTAGKGLGALGDRAAGTSDFPKQTAGESPGAYSARIKAWRESREATKQRDALSKASQ